LERQVEPLVMPSEISGLAALRGYLKLGNLVVRLSLPFIDLPKHVPGFIARPAQPPRHDEPLIPAAASVMETPAEGQTSPVSEVARTEELRRLPTGESHELSIE
jgi:hypothetical protein